MTRSGGTAPQGLVIPMGRVLRFAVLAALVALPTVTLVGWIVGGAPGAWGAFLGMAIAVGFLAVTVVVALLTAGMDASTLGIVVIGSWLVKVALLMVVLGMLREQTFYSRPALLLSLLLGVVGTLLLEGVVVTRTRVPYVEPRR